MITQEEVKNMFSYDFESGWLFHRFDHGRAIAGNPVGWFSAEGYVKTKISGRAYYVHKLIWLYVYGVYPEEIDHKDGDKSNNRVENLRLATRTQNCANANYPTGMSGLRGVKLNSEGSKWRSMIQYGGQRTFLGDFDTPEEASIAYEAAAEKLFGEFAFHRRPSD